MSPAKIQMTTFSSMVNLFEEMPWRVWKNRLIGDLARCVSFSERRGSKSRRRHWRLNRHMSRCEISDSCRIIHLVRHEWKRVGNTVNKALNTPNTHTHTHSQPPADSCPSGRMDRFRGLTDVSFITRDFDGIFSVLRFRYDPACI